MGSWYVVTKTIKGRRYLYRQRTWREGVHVRTQSHYIGPADGGGGVGGAGERDQPTEQRASIGLEAIADMRRRLMDPAAAAETWVAPWSMQTRQRIQRVPALDELVKRHGIRLRSTRKGAYFKPKTDTIHIPAPGRYRATLGNSSSQNYYHTVFHEMAHWSGTMGRTRRFSRSRGVISYDYYYAREELVAELTALAVLERLGHPMTNLAIHARYFQFWLGRTGPPGSTARTAALNFANEEAQIAADFILSAPVNTTLEGRSE